MTPSPETKTMTEKLRAHFKCMQEAAANYLEPATYIARHPDTESIGACKWVAEFPMPERNHSSYAVAEINARRDKAFILDMIYMLDGPEQREAEQECHPTPAADEVEAVASAIAENVTVPGCNDFERIARAAIAALQARSAEPAGEEPVASTGWASPALGRAHAEIEKLRNALAQDPESGIDEALRRTLDCIEAVDVQLEGFAL